MTRPVVARRSLAAAVAVLSCALAGASVAWACSRQASAEVQGKAGGAQTSGPVGAEVVFSGRDFAPASPVEVRWGSPSGQVLGQGVGPSFSVPITIPPARVGVHYIMAVPAVGNAASLAFEVTASPSASPQASGPAATGATVAGADDQPSGPGPTHHDAPPDSPTAASGSDAGPTAASSAGPTSAGADPPASATSAEPARRVANRSPAAHTASAPRGSGAGAGTERRPAAASANPAVVTTPGGVAIFGGSAGPDAVSAATVSGDTWSGFASTRPSLVGDGLTSTTSTRGAGLGAGAGLLGAGVVALLAGFVAAESSRRRALAGAGTT